MEAITELSPSCWLAIKCFPPLSQYSVTVGFFIKANMIATFLAQCSHTAIFTVTVATVIGRFNVILAITVPPCVALPLFLLFSLPAC